MTNKEYDFSIDDYNACDVFDAMNESADWTKDQFITGVVYDLVEGSVSDDVRAAESQLVRLYSHMLKFKYQPNKQTTSWLYTIDDASEELRNCIGSRKNVQNRITGDEIDKCYSRAVKLAVKETGIFERKFPDSVPDEWSIDNVKDKKFIEEFIRDNKYTEEANKWYDRFYI